MTHIPTGIQVRAEEHSNQEQNKKAAWKRLTDRLIPIMKQLQQEKNITENINTDRVRSYNQKDQRVVDTRLDKTFNYDEVLYKDALDDILVELIKNS